MAELKIQALPKWLFTHSSANDGDVISYPVGSGTNVVMKLVDANDLMILFLDAGHAGTFLASARKDLKVTITTTSNAWNLQKEIVAWIAQVGTDDLTSTVNARVLEILPNSTTLGIACTNIVFDWDSDS